MDKMDRRGISPEDDGDYAKLRELPMVARATNDHSDDNTSEDTKVRTNWWFVIETVSSTVRVYGNTLLHFLHTGCLKIRVVYIRK